MQWGRCHCLKSRGPFQTIPALADSWCVIAWWQAKRASDVTRSFTSSIAGHASLSDMTVKCVKLQVTLQAPLSLLASRLISDWAFHTVWENHSSYCLTMFVGSLWPNKQKRKILKSRDSIVAVVFGTFNPATAVRTEWIKPLSHTCFLVKCKRVMWSTFGRFDWFDSCNCLFPVQ